MVTNTPMAPGARIVVRDEEWLVRRVDPSSDGGRLLTCDGVSHDTLQAQITSLQQNLEQLAMPLPDQPIGPGAKWKYRKTIDVNGASYVR